MEIKQKLIPSSNKKARPKIAMSPKYITIHETDNTSKTANASAHANLQYRGNNRTASWHYQVDDKEIYQSIPTNEVAWHAGDGSNGTGNRQSIGIEICVNAGIDFQKAKQNAAWLVRYLMDKHNIPLSNVVQHNRWSGKNCPRRIRSDGWSKFINLIKSGGAAVAASKAVEHFYDLSIASEYKLIGKRSSKHPSELAETLAKMMEANANFIVITKRGADMEVLQKTINNEMNPDSK